MERKQRMVFVHRLQSLLKESLEDFYLLIEDSGLGCAGSEDLLCRVGKGCGEP